MDTQLHLINAPDVDETASRDGHAARPTESTRSLTRTGRATPPRPRRPGTHRTGPSTTWRLSAETRATGRRGVARARAALESAHRTGPDHQAA